ncbi:Ig-like domain-containing protein [Kitasatospora sp. GP82]|uniref:L,D-transpeptidase n=1 Tax=Kitasatospora sp. GP82 TaxID=3035089 RepID=UPI0024737597|nr:Ig-like domain-containing protein [Kitasatospora sp. GP82]MDH6128035.1 lipoprotein-anchoring transpeptidase ErfK/SrfK [Kitasatospora sp. GP82]
MHPAVRVWARYAATLGLCLLTGCSGFPLGASAPAVSRAVITTSPTDGSQNVPLDGPVKVTVEKGRLTSVRLADGKGNLLTGRTSPDGTSWTPDTGLAVTTPYALEVVAEDADGLKAVSHTAFTTVTSAHTFAAFFTPEDGSTVGVGMPLSLRFSRPITDRAAVERAVAVSSDPPVPLGEHWFGNQRIDIRPEKFWTPGTRVTLALHLKDVQGAPGDYGTQQKEVHFTIGRSQISTVDLDTRMLTVRQGRQVLRTMPVSAGGPDHPTYLGTMVISEKFQVTRMNSQTVGLGDEYDIKDVPHAMRLTQSGTFVHGNYWSPRDLFGSANTSHGCIGLEDEKGGSPDSPAGWLFGHSLVGDVVEVRAREGEHVSADNGLGGWDLPWGQWQPTARTSAH